MKKINNEVIILALVFLLGAAADSALASTAFGTYELSAAMADAQYYAGSGDHAITISGQDYLFTGADGTLIEYDDGTAMFSGYAHSIDDAGSGYMVTLSLSGRTAIAPPDSPKRELMSGAYSDNGGPVDTGTWYYYTGFSGTFDGIGALAGTTLIITQRGPAFQIGFGANNKNLNFGASAWFWAEDAQGNSSRGDINIDMAVVPIPAALQLMVSGLFALGLATRRPS
ncbi:MAG: hypothetical protein HKO55_03335 [Gammaproteobacteria bacterium]|nr:hypothetical protein [Gammaproteobacteria bacterium]